MYLRPTDRRREKRSQTLKSGQVLYGGVNPTAIDCLIMDTSDGGARVETSVMISVPEVLSLRTNDNIECGAYRRWTLGKQIGIEFFSNADMTRRSRRVSDSGFSLMALAAAGAMKKPSYPPYCWVERMNMRFMFQAMVTRFHSPRT
jgi:hypothetical protein